MTTLFIENESYKHKMAKEVLKKWFDNSDIGDGVCELGRMRWCLIRITYM